MICEVLKLIQTFVLKKFSFLMVSALFKWFSILLLLLGSAYSYPASGRRLFGNETVHPFYISVTEFNHNQKENIVEISCKMFADDFENILRAQYKTSIDITHPKDIKQLEKLMYDYVQKHLQLKINGKPVSLQFVGYEKEN